MTALPSKSGKANEFPDATRQLYSGRRGRPLPGCDCSACFGMCVHRTGEKRLLDQAAAEAVSRAGLDLIRGFADWYASGDERLSARERADVIVSRSNPDAAWAGDPCQQMIAQETRAELYAMVGATLDGSSG